MTKLYFLAAFLFASFPLTARAAEQTLYYWQCECRNTESPESGCLFPQDSCPNSETSEREAKAACGNKKNIIPNSCVLQEAGPVLIDCNAPNPPPICDRR